jgi:uncharacterized membrane protein (Fun14 family)
MYEEPMSLRDTARGIGIRAAILAVGGLVIGGWITAFAMKAAGKLIHLMIGLLLLLIGGGAVAFEVNRLKKRLSGSVRVQPALE